MKNKRAVDISFQESNRVEGNIESYSINIVDDKIYVTEGNSCVTIERYDKSGDRIYSYFNVEIKADEI